MRSSFAHEWGEGAALNRNFVIMNAAVLLLHLLFFLSFRTQ
jgi:hypothetical protein